MLIDNKYTLNPQSVSFKKIFLPENLENKVTEAVTHDCAVFNSTEKIQPSGINLKPEVIITQLLGDITSLVERFGKSDEYHLYLGIEPHYPEIVPYYVKSNEVSPNWTNDLKLILSGKKLKETFSGTIISSKKLIAMFNEFTNKKGINT